FVFTAVASLLLGGALGTAQYFALIIRDLATAVGFVVARAIPWLRPVQFKARVLGKLVTVFQMLSLAAALVFREALAVLLFLTALLSTLAIADYTLALWRARTPHTSTA
ncbi:MAG: CDP-alcohol phosphatidyltransferase family protein, partial [Gemmatimonadaceae bacterium]|nr:CDP-alcohol phosphatidyltransferase family protein [Gemmatimonadaceae bacterium]